MTHRRGRSQEWDTLCWLAGKGKTGRECTEREAGGYTCSLPSLSLFQFLQWGKSKRKLALFPTRVIVMKTDQACPMFWGLGKKAQEYLLPAEPTTNIDSTTCCHLSATALTASSQARQRHSDILLLFSAEQTLSYYQPPPTKTFSYIWTYLCILKVKRNGTKKGSVK